MIALTDKAKEMIKEIAAAEGIDLLQVRLKCQSGGCSGMTHDMYYETLTSELDEIIDFDDIKIVVDPISFQFLENLTLDYLESSIGAGFKFLNVGTTHCGCGKSFSF